MAFAALRSEVRITWSLLRVTLDQTDICARCLTSANADRAPLACVRRIHSGINYCVASSSRQFCTWSDIRERIVCELLSVIESRHFV